FLPSVSISSSQELEQSTASAPAATRVRSEQESPSSFLRYCRADRRLPLIAKIAIAMTFINTWVVFEETIVDRHGLWRYMPYYRVGLFCAWDASVLAVTVLLLIVSVAPLRRRRGPTLQPTALPLPLLAKIAIATTFLNTLVIFFVWPGVLLRVCF